eukprot:TRINITY_DN21690_c0_g1_i1.p1 TRINITY_DN21690_c0_g1~~TRINITY_DN21690_c0_g1_i1.p1  ORF type:complete len:206 (-),score=49.69 TRINITY_DN21690_c0_g1_i1:63-680(-)
MDDKLISNRVFVGGISWKADEVSLGKFFATNFGPVVECKIIMDKATGKSKGYGFVTFNDAESATKVKQATALTFMGKNMNVGDAVRKITEPSSDGSSRGFGHRTKHQQYSYPQFYTNGSNFYEQTQQPYYYGHYDPTGVFYPYYPPYSPSSSGYIPPGAAHPYPPQYLQQTLYNGHYINQQKDAIQSIQPEHGPSSITTAAEGGM